MSRRSPAKTSSACSVRRAGPGRRWRHPGGAVPPRGVLGGTPHTVRLRPVVGEVGPAPRSSTRPGDPGDPGGPAGLERRGRGVRPVPGRRDAGGARRHRRRRPGRRGVSCPAPAARRGSRPRHLLGPAGLSGNDVASVSITAHGRRRYALALAWSRSREQTFDAFVAAHFHQRAAVTLDGDTVAIVDLQPEAPQFTSTEGVFEGRARPRVLRGDRATIFGMPSGRRADEQLVDCSSRRR